MNILNKNCSYFNEREYIKEQRAENNEEKMAYWNKILGEEVIRFLDEKNNQVMLSCSDIDYQISQNRDLNKANEIYNRFHQKEYEDEELPENKIIEQNILFFNYFAPFLKLGIKSLKDKWKFNFALNENIIGTFSELLYSKLSTISIRMLVLELNICDEENRLHGDDAKQKYDYFENHIISHNYIEQLFNQYPILWRSIFVNIELCIHNFIEVINRVNLDRKDIVNLFCEGKDFNDIQSITCNLSDSHKKGKGVFILTLDNEKKIVYKPHSLKGEIAYARFLDFIGKISDIDMYEYRILNKEEYGWVEYITYESCENKEGISRYYKRLGVLILVNYLLNANDIHYENLIAHGEYPVIIDLETILHNKKTWEAKTANLKINQVIDSSVLHSGILPKYIWGKNGKEGVNVSAISGEEGQDFPIKMPVIVEQFTSNMHFEYDFPKTTKKQNIVMLKNHLSEPQNYINDILQGFSDSYNSCLMEKNQVIEKLQYFDDIEVRFIVRNTQRYSMLLYSSYHPYFMQDATDRELLLNVLYKDIDRSDKYMCSIVESEIDDLINNDIPYFQYSASDTYLSGTNNKKMESFFEKTSIEITKEKIIKLNSDDCKKQMSYIVLSLTSLSQYHLGAKEREGMKTINDGINTIKSDIYLQAADKLAEHLLNNAVFNDNMDEVNWIGISIVGNKESKWNIAPLNNYLYDGVAGVAVFFNACNQIIGNDKYKQICDSLKNTLKNYTDFISRDDNLDLAELTGAFSGESSLVYVYEVLYVITQNKEYLEYAEKHFQVVKHNLSKDNNYDILLGNAGAIHVLINLYELTNNIKYIEVALEAAKHITDNAIVLEKGIGWKSNITVNPLAGFSHGVAGIAGALLRVGKLTNSIELIGKAEEALEYEKSLFLPQMGNWCDKRELENVPDEQVGLGPVAWCHGASGILLSRLMMKDLADGTMKAQIESEIEIAANTTIKYGFNGTHCLCHGDMGNLEILLRYGKYSRKKDVLDACNNYSKYIADLVANKKWNCGLPYNQETPSFMIGLSGIGYSLLRICNPELPSIISLEL